MVVIDTNVIIRFVLKDNVAQAMKAKLLFESPNQLFIPESVFAEVDFVLRKMYQRNRSEVVMVFLFLIDKNDSGFSAVMREALSLYKKTTISMVDCLAAAHAHGGTLASFDKKLLFQTQVKPYWGK